MEQIIKHPSVKSITVYRENDGEGDYCFQVNDYDSITLTFIRDKDSLKRYLKYIAEEPSFGGQVVLSSWKEQLRLRKVFAVNFK